MALWSQRFLFCGLAKAQIQFEPDRTIKESRFGIIKNTILTIDDDAKAIVMRPLKNPNLEKKRGQTIHFSCHGLHDHQALPRPY